MQNKKEIERALKETIEERKTIPEYSVDRHHNWPWCDGWISALKWVLKK